MKLLFENWRSYLKEIGDASLEPYDFEQSPGGDPDHVNYDFVSSDDPNGDEGSDYVVIFDKSLSGAFDDEVTDMWKISYEADESMEETKEDQPLKIMSTVVAIVNDFIVSPESQGIRTYNFEGIEKSDEPGGQQFATTRTKMYIRFLKKNMPRGTRIEIAGNNVIFFNLPELFERKELPKAEE
jgi:hypothetical protein